ncbi:restriction endonuclease subunit S [Paenibacillus selenitireducens]|uniref:Restriction endonuclease subunit S n=2 Tax=Paenibacillus selenitireducens TaxID=1324314 RepID=A0A1T2XJY6_9BACL|nr:restriction endonuclease subunit S [Paenibacillus selenitireducens]OPA80164.1 restriction endonuclease subunit S [Paenibacillus selenitireducens]
MMREQAYLHMLDATAKMQWNVAMILEAKAIEAEKVRNWALNHLSEHAFTSHVEQLKETLGIHDQLVEVIDALTKLEMGLAHNLKIILNREADGGMGMGGFGGMGGGFEDQFGMGDLDDGSSSPGMGSKG